MNAFRQTSRSFLRCSLARPSVRPRVTIAGSAVRTVVTKRFTEEHEVIAYDDATLLGTLHITQYASKSLGDIVFVELPKEGSKIAKGEQIGAVESVKAASDIYAPVSGTVSEINKTLNSRPGLMSSSPETEGWLCKVTLSDPSELESLLTAEKYKEFCEGLDE